VDGDRVTIDKILSRKAGVTTAEGYASSRYSMDRIKMKFRDGESIEVFGKWW